MQRFFDPTNIKEISILNNYMSKEDKWDYTQSVKLLPPKVRTYFLNEARTMFHALSTATVEIIEDKSGTIRPGRYGDRYFRVISTNPKWYHNLYFAYKSKIWLTKKQRAEVERLRLHRAMLQSEKDGKVINYSNSKKRKTISFNRSVKKGLDSIIREKDMTLPQNPRKHEPGLLQTKLRELIFERLMNGYNNFGELVSPIEDMEFLRYFDEEIESGSYRDSYSSPDESEAEFPERITTDEIPF